MSVETLQFQKAVGAAREIIRQGMIERLDVQMMLRICDVFLKIFVVRKPSQNPED